MYGLWVKVPRPDSLPTTLVGGGVKVVLPAALHGVVDVPGEVTWLLMSRFYYVYVGNENKKI